MRTPRTRSWLAMLAILLGLASVAEARPSTSANFQNSIASAQIDALNGKYLSAQSKLSRALKIEKDPLTRVAILEALLVICVHADDAACLKRNISNYNSAAEAILVTQNDFTKAFIARHAAYYSAYTSFLTEDLEPLAPSMMGKLIDTPYEMPAETSMYLKRQLLCAKIYVELRRFSDAQRCMDKALSLLASLTNPEAAKFDLSSSLVAAIGTLLDMGEIERANGLLVSARDLDRLIRPRDMDRLRWQLVQIDLFEKTGNLVAARGALDQAVVMLDDLEIDAATRSELAARIYATRAVTCVLGGDPTCARASIQAHPFHAEFRARPRPPRNALELAYLAAAAFVAGALGDARDPEIAKALTPPLSFGTPGVSDNELAAYRAAALALSGRTGEERPALLREAARQLILAVRQRPSASFGAWYRPGSIDRIFMMLALLPDAGEPAGADLDTLFLAMQMMSRNSASFYADALAALGNASDEAERSNIHEALRIRARRDQKERAEIGAIVTRAATTPPLIENAKIDFGKRFRFRDMANRMSVAETKLSARSDPAGLIDLRRFQSALRANEVALLVAPTFGARLAYMCIRNDQAHYFVRAVDIGQLAADAKLVQPALTATYPASDLLDSQFPAAQAVRLYDALLRPFEGCVKEGDDVAWLPGLHALDLPLSALLARPPPRLDRGYDLQEADWSVRHYSFSYPGSAASMAASRAANVDRADLPFDFLGVGDPDVPSNALIEAPARDAAGEQRADLARLALLPETRPELISSGANFRAPTVLFGGNATEAAVRRQLLGSYRYLSFATHGLIGGDISGLKEPALVLTAGTGGSLDDGLLRANEIADLTLRARFVALSACNTANYDIKEFVDQLPALASAFAIAGVPSTLATLWPVDSRTSQEIVSDTFARLAREGVGPAGALAEAQRNFLDTNPSRAKFHPRFWAPFVIMGDGGQTGILLHPPAASALRLTSADFLTRGGGEVLAVRREGQGSYARLIAERTGGKYSSAVRATDGPREMWRHGAADVGAASPMVRAGPLLAVGGYRYEAGKGMRAVLEYIDARTGRKLREWEASGLMPGQSSLAAPFEAESGRTLLPLVGIDEAVSNRDGSVLSFLDVGRGTAPQEVLRFKSIGRTDPLRLRIFARHGGYLLVYSNPWRASPPVITGNFDDYDMSVCTTQPMTWLESRDRNGVLQQSRELSGFALETAMRTHEGKILLGGRAGDCSTDAHAAAYEVDDQLALNAWYEDVSVGTSLVRSMAETAAGTVLLGIHHDIVVDMDRTIATPAPAGAMLDRTVQMDSYVAGEIVALGAPHAIEASLPLDAGSDVFLSSIDASDARDILVGGALGDEAILFHVAFDRAAVSPNIP